MITQQKNVKPNSVQTQLSFCGSIDKDKMRIQEHEREKLQKQRKELLIEIEAEKEARKVGGKAEYSDFTFNGGKEGLMIDTLTQMQKKQQIKRYEEARERHLRKVKEVEVKAQQSSAFHQEMIKERREYQKKLATYADQIFNLQEKIDNSKTQQAKAQKIIEGNIALKNEQTKLLEELRDINTEGEKRSKEREEVAHIHEQSIALLKSQISQNKNKSCNNCLLYINEKQNFRLKIEQEERNQKRMERDHHLKKEQILSKCQEAMSELEKAPLSHLQKLHRLQDLLKTGGIEKIQLQGKLNNLQALYEKRASFLHEKERNLETMKRTTEECQERIITHGSRVSGLEQEIEECQEEVGQLKQSNDMITQQVRKNAARQMELKEREGELEDKLNSLRKQKEQLMAEIEALPKKQRDKILKK